MSRQSIVSFDRDEYWAIGVNEDGLVEWNVLTNSGQVTCNGVTEVVDGPWHHVCGVFDSGTLALYVDSRLEASASGGLMFGSGNTRFGFLGADSQADSFNGKQAGGRPILGDMAPEQTRPATSTIMDMVSLGGRCAATSAVTGLTILKN